MSVREVGQRGIAAVFVLCASLGAASQTSPNHESEVLVQLGHRSYVGAIAFAPDGKRAASAGADHTIKLWQLSDGRQVRELRGHNDAVTAVTFSPDGRYILSGGDDHTVRLWDAGSGEQVRAFVGHTIPVGAVAFSSDGTLIASGGGSSLGIVDHEIPSLDQDVKVWDVASGVALRTFKGHTRGVRCVAFSPDGRYVVSGSGGSLLGFPEDYMVRIWDMITGREVRRLAGHTDDVISLALSSDGRYLLSGSGDRTMRLWSIENGNEIRRFVGHSDAVQAVAFSRDGSRAFSASRDRTVRIWNVASGYEIPVLIEIPTQPTAAAFSPDGHFVLSGDFEGDLRLFDTASETIVRTLRGVQSSITSIALSPDGRYLVAASWDGVAHLWEPSTARLVSTLVVHGGPVTSTAFCSDSRRILSGSADRSARFWDVTTGEALRILPEQPTVVHGVTLSTDCRYALLGTGRGGLPFQEDDAPNLTLWDLSAGRQARSLGEYAVFVSAVAFSPRGSLAASGASDFTVRLWNTESGNSVRILRGHRSEVNAVTFSPDGQYIVSGGGGLFDPVGAPDNAVRIWEVVTGSLRDELLGHTGPVRSVAVSPDGRHIVSGSDDGTARVWELATGRLLQILRGHAGAVSSTAFSPDGRHVVSAGKDGTVRYWDLATGSEVVRLIAFRDGEWISVTPEGFYNASSRGAENLSVRMDDEIFSADRFYDAFYRPDLVEKRMRGEPLSSHAAALNLTEALHHPPPGVSILSSSDGVVSESRFQLRVRLQDRGGGIGDVRVYHNGKLIHSSGVYRLAKSTGLTRVGKTTAYEQGARGFDMRRLTWNAQDVTPARLLPFVAIRGRVEKVYTVALTRGANTIAVAAFNGMNTVVSPTTSIEIRAAVPEKRPRLWVVSAGVRHFAAKAFNLGFTVKDAEDFGNRMRLVPAPEYDRATVEVLSDPDRATLIQRLRMLRGQIAPEDVFVLFIASHGRAEDDVYYVYTADFDGDVTSSRGRISSLELMEVSKQIPALRQVFVLDTCQAGGVHPVVAGLYDARISVLARSLGMHVFAAAQTAQAARDNYQSNGLFSHFMLEGLDGQADTDGDRRVSVGELGPFILSRVTSASNGQQTPYVRNFGVDFPLTARP